VPRNRAFWCNRPLLLLLLLLLLLDTSEHGIL
jgi:hypothetical protein